MTISMCTAINCPICRKQFNLIEQQIPATQLMRFLQLLIHFVTTLNFYLTSRAASRRYSRLLAGLASRCQQLATPRASRFQLPPDTPSRVMVSGIVYCRAGLIASMPKFYLRSVNANRQPWATMTVSEQTLVEIPHRQPAKILKFVVMNQSLW